MHTEVAIVRLRSTCKEVCRLDAALLEWVSEHQHELIPLQTVRYRTLTPHSDGLEDYMHRRLLYDA